VPADNKVPSARLQRAAHKVRSSEPATGIVSDRRAKRMRAASERRNRNVTSEPAAKITMTRGMLHCAAPADKASTNCVGAGSCAPKPSKICLKVGTTQTSSAAVMAIASNRIATG
jgi:hypothetical protein